MVKLVRFSATNLYHLYGLDDPNRARFLFVAPEDSALPNEIEFQDTWGEGFYAFIRPPATGTNPFLNAGLELLQAFRRVQDLRVAWFSRVGAPDSGHRLIASEDGRIQVNAEFFVKNYSLRIFGDTRITAGENGLELRAGSENMNFGIRSDRIQVLHDRVDIRVVDGNDSGVPIAVSAFDFELSLGGSLNAPNDFDLLDVGFRYFRASDEDSNEFTSRRYSIFRPAVADQPVLMTASLDILHPQDRIHSYLAFGGTGTGETQTVGSFFRMTNGKGIQLSARNPPRPTAEADEKPRLLFVHRVSERGQSPEDPNSEFYLCPTGLFTLEGLIDPPNGKQSSVAEADAVNSSGKRFLCGNSGAEYVSLGIGDELRFHDGRPAFYDAAEQNRVADPSIGWLSGEAKTAWVSLEDTQLGAKRLSAAPNYRAQPNEAPLYTPNPLDPDTGRSEAIATVLGFQQIPLRDIDQNQQFPMVSPEGFRRTKTDPQEPVALENEYIFLETQVLHPTRRLILPPDDSAKRITSKSAKTSVEDRDTVTPQGLKVRLNSSLEWGTLLLGLSEPEDDMEADTLPKLQIHNVGGDVELFDALSRNKVFIVMDQPPATATFDNKVSIRGWQHIIDFAGAGSLFLFKFYDQSVDQLANDTSLWAQGGFLNNAAQAQRDLRQFIDRTHALANTPEGKAFYQNISNKLKDPNWNGILAINTDLSSDDSPAGFRALLGAIDRDIFRSHHLGINASRFDASTGIIEVERTSLFGLIDYCDPEAAPSCQGEIGPPKNNNEDFSYRIKQLRILFENSAITNFSCDLRIFVRKIFKQVNRNVDDAIKMIGSYERRGNKDIYTFTIAEPRLFEFDPNNQFISQIRVDKVLLGTGIKPIGGGGEIVTCKIGLYGEMRLGGLSQKWLCIERVRFSELGVELSFLLPRDGNAPVAKFLPGLIRFDLANYEVCAIDTKTMLQGLPIDPKSFYFSPSDVQISLPQLGFFPSSFFFGNEVNSSINFDYGISFTVDLGSLGGLLSILKDFKMDVLLGWTANQPELPTVGIRLPDGRKEIGIQGVMKLIIEDFKTRDLPPIDGRTPYAILLKGCVLEFLGKRIPRAADDKINIFLFPNPKDPLGSKLGWWGSISQPNDYLVGLGQRISIQAGSPPRMNEIIKLLRDFPPDATDPPTAEEEVVQDLVDVNNSDPDHIRYDLDNEWSAAFDLRPIRGLRVAAVFNDPTLYGARIELDQVLGVDTFSLEIIYRKVTDEIGVYATDIGLPSAIREIEMGAISVTLPNVGIEIYTNGDWRVDLGFPARLDFTRSFKVQAFPFIGAGGFYLGKLSGSTTTMVTVPQNYVVAVVGFGMRIGLGKEVEKGIFRFGVSVTVYGILEGAFAYEPGNQNPFEPDALAIVGRVGILAQLYGEVDFGIVKASVVIIIEVGMPFLIRNPGPSGGYCMSVPYIEANVSVSVTVVIGRIKTFLGTITIKVSFSFKTRIRLPLPIGNDACGRPPELRRVQSEIAAFIAEVDLDALVTTSALLDPTAAMRDLVFHFVPAMTVTVSNNVQRPEIVAALGVHHGDSDLPTEDFDYMVEALWLLALQAASGGTRPDKVYLRDLDERGLDRLLRQPTSSDPLSGLFEYDNLTTFLDSHFNVFVRGIDGDDEHDMALFPMIPDLVLVADQPLLRRQFKTFNVRDAAYEQGLEAFFRNMFVDVDGTRTSFDVGTTASVTELVFERYFRSLVTAANQMYLQRLEDAAEVDPTIVTNGVLLTAAPGTPSLLREPPPIPSRYDPMTFDQLAGQITNVFNSGLQLPFDTDDKTLTGLYELSGQQFPMRPLPGQTEPQEFPVRLEPRSSGLWFTVGTTPGVDKPEVGVARNSMDGIDIAKINTLTNTPLPGNPSRSGELRPVQGSPKRFGFPDGVQWNAEGEDSAIVWPIPPNLRETIDELDADGVLAAGNMRASLYRGEGSGVVDVDPPDQQDPVKGHWAVRIPFTIRQVANPDPPATNKLDYTYEIAGVSEPSRRRLDALLRSSLDLSTARLSVLYQAPGDDAFTSDNVRGNADDCHVILFRNNLSTESRPGAPFAMAEATSTGTLPFVLCQASLAESANFVELMWFCSVVNSGGYFIRYETAGNADPLQALFAGDGANQEAEVTILIEFPESTLSLEQPLRHPFVNCLVTQTHSEGDKPLLDAGTSGPMGVPPFVFANVERKASDVWHRIRQFQSVMEPGTIGFFVERDRRSDNDYVVEVDNLYSRLAFEVDAPHTCRPIPNTLPLSPILPQNTESDTAAVERAEDDTVFRFEHVMPVHYEDQTRYPAIGQEVDVSFRFRDVYGNQLPCSGSTCQTSLRMQYFDELIPITEWPGIERNTLKIVNDQGTRKLVLEFGFRKELLGLEGSGVPAEQQLRMRQRFERIFGQLNDANLDGPEDAVVWVETSLEPGQRTGCRSVLRDFSQEILAYINGGAEPASTITIDLGRPAIRDDDLFELYATLHFRRKPPEGVTEDNAFVRRQREPWESNDPIFEAARSVIAILSMPGASGGLEAPDDLLAFAVEFEEHLYNTEQDQRKLATGVTRLGDRSLWVVRSQKRIGNRNVPLLTFQDRQDDFAPAPLSNELTSASVVVPVRTVNNGMIEFNDEERPFSDVDMDRLGRFCLESIEDFLAPATTAAILCMGINGNPRFGRQVFEHVVASKAKLADPRLPEHLVDQLIDPDSGVTAKGRDVAVAAFQQRLLTTLHATYDLDSIPVYTSESCLNHVHVHACRGAFDAEQINLFGRVNQKVVGSDNLALKFEDVKVKLSSADNAVATGHIAVLVDALSATPERAYYRDLRYELTHLEIVATPITGSPYSSSTWVRFIRPQEVVLRDNAELPVPLREFPDPPQLEEHTNLPGRQDGDAIENALAWSYGVTYRTRGFEQDRIDFEIEFNQRINMIAKAATGRTLFEAMTSFREALPDPQSDYGSLRNAVFPLENKRELLKQLDVRATDIANSVFPTFRTKAGDLLDSESQQFSISEDVTLKTEKEEARKATVCWPTSQHYSTPCILPVDSQPTNVGDPYAGGDGRMCRDTDFLDAIQVWRRRLLKIDGLNIVRHENALATARIVRNENLGLNAEVNPRFVYHTGTVKFPHPLTPMLDVDEEVPIDSSGPATLRNHLTNLFNRLLSNQQPGSGNDRRMRIEVQFAFDSFVRIASPELLSPPMEVSVSDPAPFINGLAAAIEEWQPQRDWIDSGFLVFDLMLYAQLSDADVPTLRLRNLTLQLQNIVPE